MHFLVSKGIGMATKPGLKPRLAALKLLHNIEAGQKYAHLALPAFLERGNLDARDRAFVTDLVYGVVRRRLSLDYLIERFSSRPFSHIDEDTRELLELGLYQLIYMDRVPDHSVVDTCVELAKKRLKRGAEKFVNAVLREAVRRQAELPWPDRAQDELEFLSIFHSHPRWLVELWADELGLAATEALLAADNRRRGVTLRVNTRKTSIEAAASMLTAAGLSVRPGRYVPEALRIEGQPPRELFERGLIYAQDEASMLVVKVLEPRPGERIIELGAAPGGKSTHIAVSIDDIGEVVAVDRSSTRLALVTENADRQGLGSIRTVEADATDLTALKEALGPNRQADRVLVDAPCTGLGILAQRPDARWRKKPELIAELAELQLRMLENAAAIVRPDGIIIYSVCTIVEAETRGVIRRFLLGTDEFRPEPFSIADLDSGFGGFLQLTPSEHDIDGMFIAKLVRRSPSSR